MHRVSTELPTSGLRPESMQVYILQHEEGCIFHYDPVSCHDSGVHGSNGYPEVICSILILSVVKFLQFLFYFCTSGFLTHNHPAYWRLSPLYPVVHLSYGRTSPQLLDCLLLYLPLWLLPCSDCNPACFP